MGLPITELAITELARAKVNLTVAVHGRRRDGYHELQSLVTFAHLHDAVTLHPGSADALTVTGPFAHLIDGENLLNRALTLLREVAPHLRLGSVQLVKNLPVAAGLGGGSADAAALLRAVRRANQDHAARVPWPEIAARLGADVPVCLGDRPALACGKGERIAPLRHLPELDVVVVNPRLPLATASVFAALRSGPAPEVDAAPVPPTLAGLQELLDYMRTHGNDLEVAAIGLLPQIAEIKALLANQPDCRLAAMSGSGPTCFGVFSGPAEARRASAALASARPDWWVAPTVLAGAGRV
jgi:4-diphosphocytidyl-2-C-methyl-D-erythritol kinase